MAKAGSSSRFVSVNLSKSYGQPSSPSPSPGHRNNVSSVSGSSSGFRARLQSGHSGMVVLSRSGRSQPSVASISSRTAKLAIPRPVNLPSLRREHGGNDPTVPLAGISSSAGWCKQQVLASPGNGVAAMQNIPADSAAVGSASRTPESSWSLPPPQAKAIPPSEGENLEQNGPFYHSGASSNQAPLARSSLYNPPGSRSSNALNSHPFQHAPLSEKAMVVRGEDFPTLQAAVRPLSVPALQQQRDMQQKQRDKQHELKDKHVKLQELSQQQNSKADMLQLEQYAGPALQPSRPQQALPKQASVADGLSYDARHAAGKGANKFHGSSPLIRLNHTSNWGDDERETLQGAHEQGSRQSDRLESVRPRNGYQFSDSGALDHKVDNDTGRPMLRNGSASAYGRDHRDLRDHNRNGSFISQGRSTRDLGLSNGAIKGFSNQQFVVDSWEDITSWSKGHDSLKQGWSYPPKEVVSNTDARSGNLSRSFNSKNMGLPRDMHTTALKDGNMPHRGDNLGTDKFTRDVHFRDGSNRVDVNFSKHGVDDRQGDRFRKSAGGYQYGRSDMSSAGRMRTGAKSDLSGLDYGREKRVSALSGQDPFTDEPRILKSGQSLVFEAFVGLSGLEAKITKRRKDELPSFRDPARELFEAELERVQKMQEQERQRLAEDRERAIELKRKVEEERERHTREEELLRLKLEEEAREAAAQAQREQEDAARKAEEMRRAREEQKRMVMLEEERRKEAARRKLLELEQRMELRKSGTAAGAGFFDREDAVMQDEHRGFQRLNSEFDKNEDHGLSRGALLVQISARKDSMDGFKPMPLDGSTRWPSVSRGGESFLGDRNRVVEKKRGEPGEPLDDGPGLHPMMKNYHHQDIPSNELDRKSFSSQVLRTGPMRSSPVRASQSSSIARRHERVTADPFSREEHWQSGFDTRFSGDYLSTPLSTDVNTGHMDSESDGWWGTDNQRKFQEGQRLDSPPLFPYMNGGESDYPSFGRLRQSLPKQPKVPPPIFGRPSSHKQIIQSESMQAESPMHRDPLDVSKDGIKYSTQELILGRNPEKGDYAHRPPTEAPSGERPILASLDKTIVPPSLTTKVVNGGLEDVSQPCKDEVSQPDEIDQFSEQLSDLTESEEQSREDEKQAAVDMQVSEAATYADEEDGWVVQGRAEDMGEELCVKEEGIGEAVEDDLEEQEWDSSKTNIDAKSSLAHGTVEEIEESTWENQHVEDEGNGVVYNPEVAADSRWGRDQESAPKTDKQDEKHDERDVDNSGPQEVVRGGPVEPPSFANVLEYVHVGQSEGHNHVHSFIQQFQQPFSFMAVPLPQSTTMNGVPLHPPMLPSMHNLQMQQDLPYPLQMGLFPSAPPLMPNAIQIGSIQMPLQMHPQMPSVAHHHQQPPVFQFGQICQFSQPVPPMQPAFQLHHALGQPVLAQHHQADVMSPKKSLQLPKLNNSVKGLKEVPVGPSPSSRVSVDCPADSLLDGSSISKDHMDQNLGSRLVSAARTSLPLVELGPHKFPTPRVCMDDEKNQDTLVGKITGGRRRISNARSFGVYGRGRGRSSGPYSVVGTSLESSGKDAAQNWTYRQSFCRAEYKIRKPPVTSNEKGSKFCLDKKNHDLSYDKCSDVAHGLASAEEPTFDDTSDSNFYSQGYRSKVQKVKDDFIEVRSKRQLLREQRVLRDKAKVEELKVKEQIASKQLKAIGKAGLHEEASMLASTQHPADRWLVPNADLGINDGSYAKHRASVIGSSLQQFCATPNSAGAAANEPKVFKSSQYQSVANAGHSDTVKEHVFCQAYSNDSTPTINAAWDVQKSSHEVVSLTQIQLEEAISPFGYDVISSPIAPLNERVPNNSERGNSLAACSLNKVSPPVKTPLSMPGPISSLLAGEKIQFGAVTSPTVVSSPNHPSSPFVGAIGSQIGSDKANFSSHPINAARNYFRQDGNNKFVPSKIIPKEEENMNGQLVDVEAEAMAAASAVAVAAKSNDELNSCNDANVAPCSDEPVGTLGSFPKSLGLDGTGAGISQTPSKNLGVDNTIANALPADLSVETTAALPQPSHPNHSGTLDIMLQHLPSRASPFPGLEMGTILGGPIFTCGPREDAALSSFEPGLGGLGAANVGGWQHRLSNTSDSFYGAPPPFMSPAGLPSMQGHPHMLVYSHPFTPVGQFGQLGVSFMGTTYHPSGKQPDWTHVPYSAVPTSLLNQSGVDVNAGKPPALDVQHSALASNPPQAISGAGYSMMPVPAPMSVFDPNFPSPFQAQWSRAPAPSLSNYHISGPAPGLTLQPRPGELGVSSSLMHASDNLQQLPEASGGSHIPIDAATAAGVHFSEEMGFGYSTIFSNSVGDDVEVLMNRGHSAERGEAFDGGVQQGYPNLASVSSQNEPHLSSQDLRSRPLENSRAQSIELDHHQVLSHHPNASLVVDKGASEQQAQGRDGLVVDWPGTNHRRGSSHPVSTVSAGDRGPVSSLKSKQIYVSKPATPV